VGTKLTDFQLREQRKEDLQQHVEAVNAVLREQNAALNGDSDDDDDFEGFSEPQKPVVDESEAEYTDEEKYTTVTVSAMDAGNASDSSLEEEDAAKAAAAAKKAAEDAEAEALKRKKKRPWEKPWKGKDGKVIERPTQKKKKFRYESKAERSMTRLKQKSRNSAAAKSRRAGAE
jgi:ribosomal RNA-processing protein 17